ncbi:hypothetical protein C1645_840550 [Glomus cerebriforme]|uniref:NrS-1 polymerase-like helicase domain-containing protein n=1 Tax=Glomus cerebriforme TaxID=658196 RepID=A0A397S589_9GLOM|nr:hypothetical protein C1645_840550 [Glomus cerebriforme]
MKTWIFKHKKSDGGLYFNMESKLDLGKLTINIVKLGFKAKPASQINYDLVNPIIWHVKNIWCNGDKNLSEYILKYLFSPELVYSTSDLGKILGKFNSAIQEPKLIIMNEMEMASGEWHKANDHLKSLITEDYVSIERKELKFQEYGHYPRFMVLRWKPCKISPTKMKYMDNGEKALPNNIFGKKLSEKNITECKQVRVEVEQAKVPIASTSRTSETSNLSESNNLLRPVVEKSARQQREERLRKWAIDHEVIKFARENKMDPNDLFYMTRRERLISEEIYLQEFKDVRKPWTHIYDDKEWQKNISIFQENENELNIEMSIEELSNHALALNILLTDKVKRDQLTAGPKKGKAVSHNTSHTPNVLQEEESVEGGIVNVCQISQKETIRDLAQRIIRDNLSEAAVKVIAKALAESASNASANITRSANKIQKGCSKQCEDEGIHYLDYFSLESVKERLDVVTGYAKNWGQQDIPQVFRSLEKDEEWAKQLLVWIQEAISSGQLRDPRKPGVVFAVATYCAKNLSKAGTISNEALHHSSDNHASPSKRYTIVNYQKRGEPYNQAMARSSI